MRTLSPAQARRIALAAQGFGRPRPVAKVTSATAMRAVNGLGLVQIDSVNVLVRAHYVPLFARLGPYAPTVLDDLAYLRRKLFEFWGHEASLIPMSLQPLLRWRMQQQHAYFVRWAHQNATLVDRVYRHVVDRGPTTVKDLAEPGARGGPWWGWASGKTALELLFAQGRVTATTRRNFERVYDLTERVVPPEILQAPTPSREDAHRGLLAIAARALGVATTKDLADYYRIKPTEARPRVGELVEEGVLEPVQVTGWDAQAYLHRDAKVPRAMRARALVSPFDSLVWERARTERVFGFRYRIEIYTPAPKRIYGYYVLPFLLGDTLVSRVDLKADRKASALLVHAAHAEPGVALAHAAAALADELRLMADWLGLDDIKVTRKGELAPHLLKTGKRLRRNS
jgi:uncharacterized protein